MLSFASIFRPLGLLKAAFFDQQRHRLGANRRPGGPTGVFNLESVSLLVSNLSLTTLRVQSVCFSAKEIQNSLMIVIKSMS